MVKKCRTGKSLNKKEMERNTTPGRKNKNNGEHECE